MAHSPHPVWDLPTRLFHLLLIAGVFTSWLSYEQGWMDVHFYSGYTVLTMLVFRLLWGLVGSPHSRFRDFWPNWQSIRRYLKAGVSPTPGHNPLGALSVFALLGTLSLQVVSGLLNADEEGNHGPYHNMLPAQWGDTIAGLHEWFFWLLAALIALHVCAVLFHAFRGEPRIITGMISGHKDAPGSSAPVPLWRGLLVVLMSAAATGALVFFAPAPSAPLYF